MSKAKNQCEDVETLVRVRNTRAGSIHLLGYGAFELPSGVSEHPISKFQALSRHVRDHITDLELEGYLVFGEEPEPEAPPEAERTPVLPEGFQPLPGDDGLAVETIKRETSSATLDAWFNLEAHRAAVSDAIFARLTELGSK